MTGAVETVLQSALRGLSLRQQVTADNIANADTPGFRARQVRFEDKLDAALGRSGSTFASLDSATGPTVEVAEGQTAKLDGNTVDMDQQLLAMTDTTMRYNSVARALSQRLALYNTVITDGRG